MRDRIVRGKKIVLKQEQRIEEHKEPLEEPHMIHDIDWLAELFTRTDEVTRRAQSLLPDESLPDDIFNAVYFDFPRRRNQK